MVSTGAKHTSVPSMISIHSALVLAANTPRSLSFSSAQAVWSIWWGRSSPARPVRRNSSA